MITEKFDELYDELIAIYPPNSLTQGAATKARIWEIVKINQPIMKEIFRHVIEKHKYHRLPVPEEFVDAIHEIKGTGKVPMADKHWPKNQYCDCPGCLVAKRAHDNKCTICGIYDPDYNNYSCMPCHQQLYAGCTCNKCKEYKTATSIEDDLSF